MGVKSMSGVQWSSSSAYLQVIYRFTARSSVISRTKFSIRISIWSCQHIISVTKLGASSLWDYSEILPKDQHAHNYLRMSGSSTNHAVQLCRPANFLSLSFLNIASVIQNTAHHK